MNMLNQIIIEGQVVGKPKELKNADGARWTFPIEHRRIWKNKEGEVVCRVSEFDIDVSGQIAESCCMYCRPGKTVRIVGMLNQETVSDADGVARLRFSVMAEHIDFMKI